MLYPKNIEEKLGFSKIRALVESYCQSTLGKSYVDRIEFSADFGQVQKWLFQTNEFKYKR